MNKIIIGILIVGFVVGLIVEHIITVGSVNKNPNDRSKEEWIHIITFKGSIDKRTGPFYIPSSEWRIRWSYSGAESSIFEFFVYPEGESIIYVGSLITSGPSQSDIIKIYLGLDNYYIKVKAQNVKEWALVIEAFMG